MKSRFAALLSLCVVAAACSREQEKNASVLPRPFGMVANVRPGTPLQVLQETRPRARFAPYVGYEEKVGDVTYRYIVDGTESQEVRSLGSTRLDAVEIVTKQGSADQARAAWVAAFRDYQARLHTAPTCFLIEGTLANNGPAAVWNTAQGYVLLRATTGRPAGPHTPAATPLLVWRAGEGALPPVLTVAEAKSANCPAAAEGR